MRFFRVLALVCALPLFSAAAHGQASVYGAISVANYGYNVPGYRNDFIYKSDTIGFTGGATYLIPSSSRVKVGVDAHFDGSPGSRGGNAGMFSARIAVVPRTHAVCPYFQIGGGYVSAKFGSTNISGAVLDFGGGFDIHVSHHLFIRPIEIMGKASNKVGHANIGFGVGYQFSGRRG